jgi:copper chaperone CopZ
MKMGYIKQCSALLVFVLVFSCGGPTPAPEVIKHVEMSIEGMTCAHSCAPSIQIKLIETSGVKEARVNFEKKKALVSYNSAVTDIEDLEGAVESIAEGIYDVVATKEIASLPKDSVQ